MVPCIMVKVWALGFVTWFVLRISCIRLSAGVTMSSEFRKNDGVASVMPLDVASLVAAIVETVHCWLEWT